MLLLFLALLIDWIVGDPDGIWKRVPHPVVLFGHVISGFDRIRFNHRYVYLFTGNADRGDLIAGGLLLIGLLVISLVSTWFVAWVGSFLGPFWWLPELAIVVILVAQKSLLDHVKAVHVALNAQGLEAGRKAVSMIVGRDVSDLSHSEVCKASLESLAENFSDGVVAPVFWYALLGLPGMLFFKAVNTADSMIGHRNEKFEFFGKPAALLDDVLNWPAARLSALLVGIVALVRSGPRSFRRVMGVAIRDAASHRSPNAGWPEAAFGAFLGLSLGGPRRYGARVVQALSLNAEGRSVCKAADIEEGLDLFREVCFLLMGIVLLIWLVF